MPPKFDAARLLGEAMDSLASQRGIFHSEADFQHAFAWQVQTTHPNASLRLEKRVAGSPNIELDLLIELEGVRVGVELKYPRRSMTAEVAGERFILATGADDHGRYFAVQDIARLERLVVEDIIDSGALLLLTNVANVWAPSSSRRPVLYDAFRIHHGHTLAGTMAWGDWGAQGGRPPGGTGSITLTGTYPLDWHDYSVVDGVPFRYLLVGIDQAEIDLARRNTNPVQDGGDEALQPRAENAGGRIRLMGPEIEIIEANGSRRLVFPRDAGYSELWEGLAEGDRRWDPSWGFHPDDDPDSYPPGAIF
jgi:hypothetical protein